MLRTIQRGLWPPVDPALVDAGREGELAVARTRIALVVLLALSPAATLITCSAGVAVAPIDGNDAVSLLSIADVRLLAAKSAGRDRLMVAG